MSNLLRWWSDTRMIRALIEAARYEGNPLSRICQEMAWGISFSEHDLTELEKYLRIIGPMETMFSALNSDKKTTIQHVFPSILVN